jgi:2-oxoglutarate ferredoxin oxidoreductase subunit alpha
MDRLKRKYDTARTYVPAPQIDYVDGAQVGLLAFGTTDVAVAESRYQMESEYELKTNYFRLRAIPFGQDLIEFIDRCDRVYVIEQNRDAQMAGLMKMELSAERIAKLRSVLHYTGIPMDARFITVEVIGSEKGEGH